MSEPSETSGRPLASTTKQEHSPEANTINPPSSTRAQQSKSSHPSDDSGEVTKASKPHRRPGSSTEAPSGPHAGSSRNKQRSNGAANMLSQSPSINYTRTGRISKAKKGLKVHNCECGRSYTRAEHLRRHQKNHSQDDALVCDYAGCGKPFHRPDLLLRHRERHNEAESSSPQVDYSQGSSPQAPHTSAPVIPSVPVATDIQLHSASPYSTMAPMSPVQGMPATSSPKQHIHYNNMHRNTSIPMAVDGMPGQYGWTTEPYSPSSGYNSPTIGAGDYNLYPHPYGHGLSRTRTPSNASLQGTWAMTPRSPSSSISTMPPYTWASNEKMPAVSLAYMNTYPMASMSISTSMEATAGYGQFDPKTMIQRDEDEAAFLYRDQQYGMGQLAQPYPSDQYLNNYWRLFHPTFPVVHRSTFESMSSSPMLRAAMVAIDGQYSNDAETKRIARVLHDRCIKMLEKREREPTSEPDRLCDHQTVFLVEVLSQYRARRAAKTLSPRFGTLYHKVAENFRQTSFRLFDIVQSLPRHENINLNHWLEWIDLATWQHLLAACYVLESQQAILLGREPVPSHLQDTGMDLPFPIHISVWDAVTLTEWAFAAQQYSSPPRYVYEVAQESLLLPCDSFQSSVLLAATYNRFDATLSYSDAPTIEDVDHILDSSFATKQKLLTAKLLQVTPIRALLAVSGESWILSEKVASSQHFTMFKNTLRTWAQQIWTTPANTSQPVASKEALKTSVDILQLAMDKQAQFPELNMGSDMGVYFASLVLWAITTTASTRAASSPQVIQPDSYSNHSQSIKYTSSYGSLSMASTPIPLSNSFPPPMTMAADPTPTMVPSGIHSLPASPSRHDSLNNTTIMSHEEIAFNSIAFLPIILGLVSTPQQFVDHNTLQTGCISMLLWVKLQLRGGPLEDHNDLAIWPARPGDGLGELLDSVVGSLERILSGGWTKWGI